MGLLNMDRLQSAAATIAVVASLMDASCYVTRVPDLSFSDAGEIISRAPEFNHYARLSQVERLVHEKDSGDSVTFGKFTFQYLNAPVDATLIEASVDFRYHEGKLCLNTFDCGRAIAMSSTSTTAPTRESNKGSG